MSAPTSRDCCHPQRLCPVWQASRRSKRPQLHHWGPSALIGDIHYPKHICTWLYANQPKQLLPADNPKLSLAKRTVGRALFLRRAWGSGEEGAGNSSTELLPSFQGGVAGGLPKGRMSRQQRRGLLRAQAATSALSNGPAGHPSSFLHLGLLTDMCFLCEKRCRVFFWLLQWLFNEALILYPVCYK